jgi:hypothetical protein
MACREQFRAINGMGGALLVGVAGPGTPVGSAAVAVGATFEPVDLAGRAAVNVVLVAPSIART